MSAGTDALPTPARRRRATWWRTWPLYPAVLFLGLWFALQVLTGLFGDPGHLAVWAHAGGFVAGVLLIGVLPRARRRGPPDTPYPRAREAAPPSGVVEAVMSLGP